MNPNSVTLGEWVARWLETLAVVVHPRTAMNYGRWIRMYALPLLGERELAAITRWDVREATLQMRKSGASKPTTHNVLAALSACFTAAAEQRLIPDNGLCRSSWKLVKIPKSDARSLALTREHLRRFLAVAARSAPQLVDLFTLLARTGLRFGEALALQRDDIDLGARRLWVRRTWSHGLLGPPKSRAARAVDLSRHVVAILAHRLMAAPHELWLFPSSRLRDGKTGPWDQTTVRDIMCTICEDAGLPKTTPKQLRHTFATYMIEDSGDLFWVQRQLGHADPALTANLYGFGAQPRRFAALDRADRRLHPRPASGPPVPTPRRRPPRRAGEPPGRRQRRTNEP